MVKCLSVLLKYRISRPKVFCKKGVLRNFAEFTGKHLCQRLFFNKVAGLPGTLLKKSLRHRCFPVNFTKFLRTPFFKEHLRWLFLKIALSNVKHTEGSTKQGWSMYENSSSLLIDTLEWNRLLCFSASIINVQQNWHNVLLKVP